MRYLLKNNGSLYDTISHRQYPIFGLQFHPETILTEYGLTLLSHFLNYEHECII